MSATVPTQEAFNELQEYVLALEDRITALEQAQATPPDIDEPPDPGDGGQPPNGGSGMVATISATETPYHGAGPFEFREADGQSLEPYNDPRGRFTVGCTRCTHPDIDIVADFLRYHGVDEDAACVVMQRGTTDPANLNSMNQVERGVRFGPYSVVVEGEFEMHGETHEHYDGSEWRVCSWGAADNWPFALTPVEELQRQGIIGIYDPELGAKCCQPALAGMKYLPMKQHNGINETPGFICGLRMLGGSTGVDSAIGLEGEEVSAWLAGQTNMVGTVFEQAEAYHAYPWMRIDPATGAPIRACGKDGLFTQAQINNGGNRAIGCLHVTQSQATILGPPGTVIPGGTQITDCDGNVYNIMNPPPAAGIGSSGVHGCNLQAAHGSPFLPQQAEATLTPPVEGCHVEWNLAATNAAEGADGISIDANHTPNGGFLTFMLTGDPYHLRAVQAKAQWTRSVQPWTLGYTGVEWVTRNGFWIGSSRQQAWFLRDIAEAVIATPDEVPSWLNPREDFAFTLAQILEGYTYRWDHPAYPGAATTNFIDCAANQISGSMFNDYFNLALVRALVADPNWSSFVDRVTKNIRDRFDPTSGWCNTIASWYDGIDFRPCTTWEACFEAMKAHGYYSRVQNNGEPGLTSCFETLEFRDGQEWNTPGTSGWLYAAMTRLKQLGFGGDQFEVAYEAFVPTFRAALMSGTLSHPPLLWKLCFQP